MAEPLTVSLILAEVVKKIFETLAGKVTEALWDKIKGDPAQRAFQQALASAIRRYATSGTRLGFVRPLLAPDGPLQEAGVAAELAEFLRFERPPNAALVGARWKDALDDVPAGYDFTAEAAQLLALFERELRSSDVFRPAFQTGTLHTIATQVTLSAESLRTVEARLDALTALLDSGFGSLVRAFAVAASSLRGHIHDFTGLVEEKTRDFVGRQFVFDAIDRFTRETPRGYFFVRGDPGIGKSALAARLVRTRGAVHHFNVRAEGVSGADLFLRSVCAQLIVAYGLAASALPAHATRDSGYLSALLEEVSSRRAGRNALLVVDALDEADTTGLPAGTNPLYLPTRLPPGIHVVVTSRKQELRPRGTPLDFRIDCEQDTLYLEADSVGNLADVRAWVQESLPRPGIQAYLAAHGLDEARFVDHLVAKSEGNFMYLHYVLPEIERGAYTGVGLDALPIGLRNYYESHWRRMKGQDEAAWFRDKLPVVMALTVLRDAVSIQLLAEISGVERVRVLGVLQDWAQFLSVERSPQDDRIESRYRVYHSSFHDFVAGKEEVVEERVSLEAAHRKIAASLLADWPR